MLSPASFLTIGESFKSLGAFVTMSVLELSMLDVKSSFGNSTSMASSTTFAASSFVESSPPSSIRPTPTSTVSPSSTSKEVTFPENGDGTSVSTLSVEISSIGSSSLTSSPTATSHLKIVPSVTVSPS